MTLVVITGATNGIGRAAAIEMGRQGAEVAIVGRSPERVAAVASETRSAGAAAVHEHVADLELMAEVRALAAELASSYPRIDVLANNAGAIFASRGETAEGLERTFALNHLLRIPAHQPAARAARRRARRDDRLRRAQDGAT